jgi:hypothetical protein
MAERQRPPLTDADLERALAELGRELDYPHTPDLTQAVRARITAAPAAPRRRSWDVFGSLFSPRVRRYTYACVVLLALASLLLAASPGTRDAVADRLGIGGADISTDPPVVVPTPGTPPGTLAELGTTLQLGALLPLEEARARLAFEPLSLPSKLGEPDAVYVLSRPQGDQLTYVYVPREGLPEVVGTGVGALVMQFAGDTNESFIQKQLQPGTTLELVTVNGQRAYWLSGEPHTFMYADPNGDIWPETVRLAGNTLLWEVDGKTLRIESALPQDEVIRLAEEMSAP